MSKALKVESYTRLVVLHRAKFACERCKSVQNSINIHHRTPRGMGGTRVKEINEPANLIVLCGSGTTGCHGWVESNRKEAFDLGLLVRRGQNAEVIPFTDIKGNQYMIYNNGEKFQIVQRPDVHPIE